tara:strand:- start:41679 stop:42617 length:939 start_codon:yes stop_codon:yes gene_type:complete
MNSGYPTLRIWQGSGFFSCCTLRLEKIIQFLATHQTLPSAIDCTKQFRLYKPVGYQDPKTHFQYDPIPDFFQDHSSITLDCAIEDLREGVGRKGECIPAQSDFYNSLNYKFLSPLINKYFTPSPEVLSLKKELIGKYRVDPGHTCVLLYRGLDKRREMNLASYEDMIHHALKIKEKNPTIRFLIQSDETEFIEYASRQLSNSFYFKDEIFHLPKSPNQVAHRNPRDSNYIGKSFLAMTHLFSECKYALLNHSGNCCLWIALYRGSAIGLSQYSFSLSPTAWRQKEARRHKEPLSLWLNQKAPPNTSFWHIDY